MSIKSFKKVSKKGVHLQRWTTLLGFRNSLFPLGVLNILFIIQKWCLKNFELHWQHIWEQSTQNNPSKISMHDTVRTISLIKLNLSFNSNTSNSDQPPPFSMSTKLFLRMEWNKTSGPDPLGSICPQEIFKPQSVNFG